VFSKDRQSLFCTVKDASQQVDDGEEDESRHHKVRLVSMSKAVPDNMTKPVIAMTVFGLTITLSAIGVVLSMPRGQTSHVSNNGFIRV
jgi:hypothetical protein